MFKITINENWGPKPKTSVVPNLPEGKYAFVFGEINQTGKAERANTLSGTGSWIRFQLVVGKSYDNLPNTVGQTVVAVLNDTFYLVPGTTDQFQPNAQLSKLGFLFGDKGVEYNGIKDFYQKCLFKKQAIGTLKWKKIQKQSGEVYMNPQILWEKKYISTLNQNSQPVDNTDTFSSI